MMAMQSTQAQTLHILHAFTNGADGGYPFSGVTLDRDGNIYGTTASPITNSGVYELIRQNSGWIFKPLYRFQAQDDGQGPTAPVVFGPDGALYGTTAGGGYRNGGTVYSLRPSLEVCLSAIRLLNETRVYWFGGDEPNDGLEPGSGPLVFDSAGSMYGTTLNGGPYNSGTVFELFRTQNGWAENIIYNFPRAYGAPSSGVTFDAAGNLFGTTWQSGYGRIYELVHTGQGWNMQIIFTLPGGNSHPQAGLIFDANGNAYGATEGYFGYQPGTVFQLSPQADGTWQETVLHQFDSEANGPVSNLAMDAAGNLYGTTPGAPSEDDRWGMVFKLSLVNGSWTFTQLYEFTDGADGANPAGGVSIDSSGNLYGACTHGGANDWGTVWEITP